MPPRRLAYAVATAAVMIVSLLLGAPGGLGTASAVHGPSSASPISAGSLPAAGIVPDAGPYTIIDPGCGITGPAPLSQAGTTYTVTGAFTGALVDECPNSVINGSGFTITPSSGTEFGVQVNTTSNVTVEDVVVGGTPTEAVEVINATDVNVSDLTSATGMDYGVYGLDDDGLNVSDSYLNASVVAGAGVTSSGEVALWNTFACSGAVGLAAVETSGLTVVGLNATHNRYGITLQQVTGAQLSDSNVSYDSVDGIDEAITDLVSISNVYAAMSGIGVTTLFADRSTVTRSNLSSDTEFGYEGELSDGLNLSDSNLSMAADDGASFAFSSSIALWSDSLNGSALDGLNVENSTNVTVGDSWASDDGWNGLRGADTSDLTTWGNVLDNTSGANGNGTELLHAADPALHGDRDSGESVGVRDIGSTDLGITGVNTTNDSVGLDLVEDSGVSVTNSSCLDTSQCAGFVYSSDDSVVHYIATNATSTGIIFQESNQISLSNSVITGSAVGPFAYGVVIEDAYEADLFNDSVANFQIGIVGVSDENATVDGVFVTNASAQALLLLGNSGSIVENGNYSSSAYGFQLVTDSDTSIVGNTFYNDSDDFVFDATNLVDVQVYWNNFVDGSGWDVDVGGASATNLVFDHGYPGGGNFWSNWTSPDSMSGPSQNLPGPDGIVDNPLPIAGMLEDPYPLTRAVTIPDTNVEFVGTGLPTGAAWSVTFNGTVGATTSNSLIFSTNTAAIGVTLGYSVEAPAGWNVTPAVGMVLTSGSALLVQLAFSPVTYAVSFTESGLPSGLSWSVTLNGTQLSSTTGSISAPLSNGTYNYTVGAIAGYTVTPASGSVLVAGAGSTISLAFTPVEYAVHFTENGLPTGSTWTVTFAGSTKSLASPTISFTVANGSYTYTVGPVAGYSLAGGSGHQTVAGPGASVQVAFTANSSSAFGTGSPLFWALVAAIAVLAIALIAVLLLGRRKPPAPTSAWTPPPASGGNEAPPSAAAGAPAPPPGATGGAPEWKE